ncbi:ATP-binding cassette domain-containing protein [Serratia symbiotica]|uniref:ATP-binding cassette domain-containing protein n=1 Tax=Serratia symbiotica TaxID=138074 RepID=A0A068YYD6_9GAMM|nr:ATP-binding cassette domain-containing protein [Serratia symbiotica]QLH61877.1 ATP-binding cassette domain-containing protein [Serratia symbiotica]CDS56598.1 putative ABC transporter [Serratia symbiotica]
MRKRQYAGVGLFLLVAFISLIGPWLAPYAIDEIRDMPFSVPNSAAWIGTDYLGEDVFSRLLSGGQYLLLLACLSVLLAWLTGGLLGMFAALQGRWIDRVLLLIADILLSIPGLLLLTLVVTVSGRGYQAAVFAAMLVMLPDIFRLVRAATLQQLQQDYVDMARCRGESLAAILCREIAPNLLPLLSADVGIRLLAAIFILATASFLGLAAQQPLADWGLMIMENRQGLSFQPWATLAPIIAILLLLIPLNLSLDGLNIDSRRRRFLPDPQFAGAHSTTCNVLDIQQFSLKLPEQTLIKALSLQLKTGEIAALVGSSGSGKSTLLRAALGHFPNATDVIIGEVWLADQALSLMNARALRKLRAQQVGFVPQDPRLSMMPSQTLGAFLGLMAARRGLTVAQRDQQVTSHFRQLGLPDDEAFLQRYPHQISGGQRQRVMVVAAMLGYPALLLMDEPTSAQDGISTQAVMHWIASTARARHMSVLFVAHDFPQASQIADRILVMSQGEMVEQQHTQAFLRAPNSQAGQQSLNAWQLCAPAQPDESSYPVLLSGEGIGAAYDGRTALVSLQFSLRCGETLTIAGRSGGGKTTFLRTLAGLQPDASGTLSMQNTMLPLKIHQRSQSQKWQLQYVAQNPASSLNPFYCVRALLQRPLRLIEPTLNAEQCEQRIRSVLSQVGLEPNLLSRKPAMLSGGQQQRVALARALISCPDILLCDEVTSAVDGPTRMELVKLLQHLQRNQGIALMIITHDLTLPKPLGGTLMVIDQGRVSELLARPAHEVTRQLIGAAQLTTDTQR